LLRLRAATSSPLQSVEWSAAKTAGVELYLKRDDLLHAEVSGNKWRKLIPQMAWLLRGGVRSFATVGGIHSNHLSACAALARELGVTMRCYVRGRIPQVLTPTLQFVSQCGANLEPVSREQVRRWRGEAPANDILKGATWLPEGGTSRLALLGMSDCYQEIVAQLGEAPTVIAVAAGSGGTAAGLARATDCSVLAYDVVGDAGLPQRTASLISEENNARLHWHSAELSGFASGERLILDTMAEFERLNGVQLDPIYTAKLLIALTEQLESGVFAQRSKLVMVHTGGLQGLAGWMGRYQSK
jgi:1-aminocyclopropane-1-carboxylate deaminase/D-cysteine desulfhydrase-like pyridoxal-dependent ACC family enzyme